MASPLPGPSTPSVRPLPPVDTRKEEYVGDYQCGGYHHVQVWDTFAGGRYLVVRKLGWGHFSTCWLVKDSQTQRHVAMKIVKSSAKYKQTALDEIDLLRRVSNAPNPTHPGRDHVVTFLDSFLHPSLHTPPSREPLHHVCMTFEPLGENLLSLLRRYQPRGIPAPIVKRITKQVLLGLDFLHTECKLIHTDMKPENVMVVLEDVEAIVEAELAATGFHEGVLPPSELIGVPLRGPQDMPREERYNTGAPPKVFIFGSQPLPSPTQSWSATLDVDRLARRMEKLATAGLSASGSSGSAGTITSVLTAGVTSTAPTSPGSLVPDSTCNTVSSNHTVTQDDVVGVSSVIAGTLPMADAGVQPGKASMEGAPSLLAQTAPSTIGGSSPASSAVHTCAAPPSSYFPASVSPSTFLSQSPASAPSPPRADPLRIRVKIADLGNATPVSRHYTEEIQTRQYRCPEVILGFDDWDTNADVWSLACMTFELLTGEPLFQPQKHRNFTKDDDHIAQIIELLGDMPEQRKRGGVHCREIFRRNGKLRFIHQLNMWPLKSVMKDKYRWSSVKAQAFADFLEPMMALEPRLRCEARDMIDHPWLEVGSPGLPRV
ncbi:hypothetical protein BOTBODRAFT_55926 [Botryobasidium botryosum FD-172 SS1]|uniref:non-specific serine/threonine protein kinase n=1 Tax=Botryobasidium botryosum (strain FD-172 SS1) TaxID=930990 RepID=A0A067MQ12_BOTB1|nr:hypothetical protein BOTBODRAFT_55926 [Botryobasidium botryosum FD-172 SS1]